MNWFTSDEHYNHTNIITKFVFRPFRDADNMNHILISRHNSRVATGDTVYHLGDFRVSNDGPSFQELVPQLNGRHVFIKGNHDKNNGVRGCQEYGVIQLYSEPVLLIHRPEDAVRLMEKLSIKIAFVGHVHEKWKFLPLPCGTLINVGVDQWDYYPIHAKQIFKALKGEQNGNAVR